MANVNVTKAAYDRLNVFPHTKEKLLRLKNRDGCSLAQMVEDAATFLLKTGIRPKDDFESSTKQFANLEQLLKKRTDTIIAFFRESEKSLLIPMNNKLSDLIEALAEKEIETGRIEKKPIAEPEPEHKLKSTGRHTADDERLIRLREENEELRGYISEVVQKIRASKTTLRTTVYHLDISENLYNELKTKFS